MGLVYENPKTKRSRRAVMLPEFRDLQLHRICTVSPQRFEQVGFAVHPRSGRVSPIPQQHVELRGVAGHEELKSRYATLGDRAVEKEYNILG